MHKKRDVLGMMNAIAALAAALVLLSSFSLAAECISYEDCDDAGCTGMYRACSSTRCIYSGCILGSSGGAYVGSDGRADSGQDPSSQHMFGLSPIILFAVKFMIMSLVGIVVAMLLSFLKIEGFMKYVVMGILVLIVFAAALLLFRSDIGSRLDLGIFSGSTHDYSEVDRHIISYVNSNRKSLDEKIIGADELSGLSGDVTSGKEYRISDSLEESVVMVFYGDLAGLPDLGKAMPEVVSINARNIIFYDDAGYATYVWTSGRSTFIIRGEKRSAEDIAESILDTGLMEDTYLNRQESAGYDDERNILQGIVPGSETEIAKESPGRDEMPPEIVITEPQGSMIGDDARIEFIVSDDGSGVDGNSILVAGIGGFGEFGGLKQVCVLEYKAYRCGFYASGLSGGKNQISITAADNEGNGASVVKDIFFDDMPPAIRMIDPEPGSYTHADFILFEASDELSGVSLQSIVLESRLSESMGCDAEGNGHMCSFRGIGLAEGNNTVIIKAEDNAGNLARETFIINLDTERPRVNITEAGFVMFDESGIDPDSVIVNKRRYDVSSCKISNMTYACSYKYGVMEIFVRDNAGNSYSNIYKRER